MKNLNDIAKEAKREYQREWRFKNKDRVREHNKRYWEKVALKRLQDDTRRTSDD